MLATLKPTQNIALLDVVPASAATGTYTTGWLAAAKYEAFLAVVQNGALGSSGTIDAKIQQAQDSSGTNAKDVTATIMTQNTQAGGDSNKVNLINLLQRDLDIPNGFGYFRLSITVGTATSVVGGLVYALNERYAPAAGNNGTAVKQVVNG